MKWISVKEFLPPEPDDGICKNYLVWVKHIACDIPQVGFYNGEEGGWICVVNDDVINVTHWSDCIEPPEGE